jgi:7,8-dihydro-6-hydroxymethylpterin dimethyltransferase
VDLWTQKGGDLGLNKTNGYCIECRDKVNSLIFCEDNKVYFCSKCGLHHSEKVEIWSDVEHYESMYKYNQDESKAKNIDFFSKKYFYPQFITNPILGLIEVTQRCNLNCPVCYRSKENLKTCDNLRPDPGFDEIIERLQRLKKERPDINPTIAFTGGEPTLRDDLPRLIYQTHKIGFARTEVITNGLRIADDIEYAKELKKSGLSQLGFQFDGFDDNIYLKIRGRRLLETKLKALENLKKIHQPTILAVCVVNKINTQDIGRIVQYAFNNKNFIEHINLQTFVLTKENGEYFNKENKIDLYSVTGLIEDQTNSAIKKSDFYPPIQIKPVPEFIEAITNKPQKQFFPLFHPACNLTTYVHVSKGGKITSINKALRIDEFLEYMQIATNRLKSQGGFITKTKVLFSLTIKMLTLIKSNIFRKIMLKSIFKKEFDPLANLQEILMISCADYMDYTEYDSKRTEMCGLFFILDSGRSVPFCVYNLFGRELLNN